MQIAEVIYHVEKKLTDQIVLFGLHLQKIYVTTDFSETGFLVFFLKPAFISQYHNVPTISNKIRNDAFGKRQFQRQFIKIFSQKSKNEKQRLVMWLLNDI